MNERHDTGPENFAEAAKRRFDESVVRLDGETRSRLNRSRRAGAVKNSGIDIDTGEAALQF